MTTAEVRAQIDQLAKTAVGALGPLPTGDLGAHLDSVQRLSLVVAIEDHFEICFDPEDEEGVQTLDDVVALVHGKLPP